MHEHISTTFLIIGIAIVWVLHSLVLLGFLWGMIKLQSFNFEWLPLIGAAFLSGGLDLFPLVGHFIAVPSLYLCIWKITRASMFPDAVFTVAISYALMRGLAIIMLAYAPMPHIHPAAQDNYGFDTNSSPVLVVQSTNETVSADSVSTDTTSDNKNTANVSIKGMSRDANGAMVTIQCGSRTYTISLGEGVTASTDDGPVAIHFLEAGPHTVTLSIGGQVQKFAVK